MFDQVGSKTSMLVPKNYNSLTPLETENKHPYIILKRVGNYLQTLEPL